ncbi:hypothetical protein MA5S0422_1968 [Mycobacteroides abscessus 5S-0422]|uniref:ATP-binding protein n=1 Tax=Mycobacteroides abscessus TaxID=36809 RepID=UPI0002681E51|nr:ATP-binding protein [Mycobacteroides abscessus]EIU14719.1 hypothetical protein MA5S0304_0953 [Mycobacteroides abscessus 5S-0304]EIU15820.1 hypothetical protein MA5S0421_1233 [Mycobacteroides abscessus 5S-0421]EIU16463.1 hypothetical protein MA5S0422_1968 [Mycobacteroides abscessus 5S-0422]EIU27907.1 hypothetical protein MA5S0708_1458 [Mycobacteroides abscessus 5S-0708]EIU32366.1 hypothetical protein MA5S0817_1011 [Mycobacteroides abscessus 5S-0817]
MELLDPVRPSRDGDQFHYVWAARHSLRLLEPNGDLVMIVVEGSSDNDTRAKRGEQVIDLAEYYGSSELSTAKRVVYRQFKHTTLQEDSPWTASWCKKTLVGFAERYKELLNEHPQSVERVTFTLTTNRPAAPDVHTALTILGHGLCDADPSAKRAATNLRHWLRAVIEDEQIASFVRQVAIEDSTPNLQRLREQFENHLAGLLPGAPTNDHILLKEMIAIRATSLHAANPRVLRRDVLAALRVTEEQLMPAQNIIAMPDSMIVTHQDQLLAEMIARPYPSPVIVHAASGIGKSMFAQQLGSRMPAGSTSVVYDCFGNGTYRRPSSPRHEDRQGLIQICNELAAKGLCDVVIPSASAQSSDYFHTFKHRIDDACTLLRATHDEALLVVVVDAADNACLAARDLDAKSFVPKLLREQLPENCRLVVLCRTERLGLLEPPANALTIELEGFNELESMQHLATHFPEVSLEDGAEFHRVSGGNPRAQADAMESKTSVHEVLQYFGGTRQSSEQIIDQSIRAAIESAKDAHRDAPRDVDRMCECLAALRPMIPIRVLATVAGVPESLVHSFVTDLRRPLLIDGNAVQFRDEPTETWFQQHYKPTGAALTDFLGRVTQLAGQDPYIATSLPDLLLDAGRIEDLVQLALSQAKPEGLFAASSPREEDLERYEIAQHTVQLALKGALRARMNPAVGRLALKAGNLAAGRGRRLELVRQNPDLAAEFLEPSLLEHLIATRALAGEWPGSDLVIEASLLSKASGQQALARNRLRSAVEWTKAWVDRSVLADEESHVRISDIAELAWAYINTDGPQACTAFLARWTPRTIAFDAGIVVARRLAEVGRVDDLQELAGGSKPLKHLQLAVAQASWESDIDLSTQTVRRIITMLKRHKHAIELSKDRSDYFSPTTGLDGIWWIVALGTRFDLLDKAEGIRILDLYLPENIGVTTGPWYRGSTVSALRGFAIRSRLEERDLDADAIAGPDIQRAKEKPHTDSQSLREYRQNVVPLCKWFDLWSSVALGLSVDVATSYQTLAANTMRSYSDYQTPRLLINATARIAVRLLADPSAPRASAELAAWCAENVTFLSRATFTEVIRIAAANPELHGLAIALTHTLGASIELAREESSTLCDDLVALARATYNFDCRECRHHFQQAVETTERAGDDLPVRWRALMKLAESAARLGSSGPRAYRLLQIAESVRSYQDETDLVEPIAAAGLLNPCQALAMASRWRDRRTASLAEISRAFTKSNGPLNDWPLSSIALTAFDEDAYSSTLLIRALRKHPGQARRIVEALAGLQRSTKCSAEFYTELDALAEEIGLDLTGTIYDPDKRNMVIREDVSGSHQSPRSWRDRQHGRAAALEALRKIDFTTPTGWDAAFAYVRGRETPAYNDDIIELATAVQPSRLSSVVAAFHASTQYDLFDCRKLLSTLDARPNLPNAVRDELITLSDVVVKRFARQIACVEYDPIAPLAASTGIPARKLIAAAIHAVGNVPERLTSNECYALAIHVAALLDAPDLNAMYDDCAELFTDIAARDASDGAVETLAQIQDNVPIAVASFIWAALGDPSAAIRWRAAHAARLLIESGAAEEVSVLREIAEADRSVVGFVDSRLVFYEKHARQWLLFAIEGAASTSSARTTVSTFEGLLRSVVYAKSPHVVMQRTAKKVLIALTRSHSIQLSADEIRYITAIGEPIRARRPDATSRDVMRAITLSDLLSVDTAGEFPDSKVACFTSADELEDFLGDIDFRFDMDYVDYWCDPLADAFGLHKDVIEHLVNDLLLEVWQISSRGGFEEDSRHVLGLYRSGTSTYKADWPENDDLDFYLSIHALYEIAGRLVARLPTVHVYDDGDDEWAGFLQHHIPTRSDGRWLSDRRDAGPVMESIGDCDRGSRDSKFDEWVYQISRRNFDRHFEPIAGWPTVWGRRTSLSRSRSEYTNVSSALIHPQTAQSLLRALRLAPSVTPLRIPDAQDHDWSGTGLFRLGGWIESAWHSKGLDDQDPYSGDVSFPPARPARAVVNSMHLSSDADMRYWTREGVEVLRSTVWDDTLPIGQHERAGSSGDELTINPVFLRELLRAEKMSLLVEVEIRRYSSANSSFRHRRNDDEENDQIGYAEPSAMYYIYGQDGEVHEL